METSQQEKRTASKQIGARFTAWLHFAVILPFIGLIRIYQWCISPMLGPHCRFEPSCSHYSVEALQRHGLARGTLLTLNRVRKCHPWHQGGCDPVPPISKQQSTSETET